MEEKDQATVTVTSSILSLPTSLLVAQVLEEGRDGRPCERPDEFVFPSWS